MKTFAITLAGILAAAACDCTLAAGGPSIQRLALCQDSWLDWKDDSARMAEFVRFIDTQLEAGAGDGAFTPKAPLTALEQSVTQVYPQSVGMGVGFSLVVDAGPAQVRPAIEQQLGKPMTCSTSEGVRACEVKLGPKKTAMLMTGLNGQARTSLLGCFYFYQQ